MAKEYLGSSPLLDTDIITKGYVDNKILNIALNDVGDVNISSVADGELIVYDSTTATWINQTLAEAGIASSTHNHDTQYLGINAKAADSDKLDGQDSTAFSLTTHNHDSTYLKLTGGTLTGDLGINKALAVINSGSSSSNVLSLQSMGTVEIVIDSNNDNTDKLFAVKSNAQTNEPITKVDEVGNLTTAGYVSINNGSARMEYNSSTESIDFVFA